MGLVRLGRPLCRTVRRQQILTVLVAVGAIAFPLLHDNDADIDSAANAAAYATLALGLNIVVGFAGLLDLGYAAFFAIGAYAYGILTSFQVMPHWGPVWEPFAWLATGAARARARRRPGPLQRIVLDHAAGVGADRGGLRRAVRRTDPATARRLPGDRDTRLRRDRADRGAQRRLALPTAPPG